MPTDQYHYVGLFGLAVPPEHQFKGIGTMLMASGLAEIDSLGAKVIPSPNREIVF